jgi:hypothetical protein
MPSGYAPLGQGSVITQCTFGSRAKRKGSHSRCAQGLRKEVRWEGVIVQGILIVSRGVRRINQFELRCTVMCWWRCGFVLVHVISTWLERGDE